MDYALIGNHPAIQKIRELIALASDTDLNVLLLGETGTGKEVVARLLHSASSRKNNRFIKVNCAALPMTLLESELFGYEKGAFTGADKFKPGKFELASEGVIFLDEIGDMPLLLQAKLLEVLQSNEFSRLGGTDVVKVRTWVVASTNHVLEKDIKDGRFREDLYYRLNVIRIELPPLRERTEDIGLLVDHFVGKYRKELNIEDFSINAKLEELFKAYPWPGNIRELSSFLLRLMIGDDPALVQSEIVAGMSSEETHFFAGNPLPNRMDEVLKRETLAVAPSLKVIKARAAEEIERKAIVTALNKTAWNKREAAKILKISYKALFNKLNSLGIRRGL
ncbi:MAG: sigma-54-dependent Fis family transcriptional regulator [Deltaproteobacteria bacterium]|nr:sigma-54-dependent Fis family transcriptional regulator [Deltaproteobacteria bacterium]